MEPEQELPAALALRAANQWRSYTRAVRHGRWFALVAFGLITLAAAPFFWQTRLSCPNSCPLSGQAAFSVAPNPGPLGNPLVYGFVDSGIGRWISLYWIIALPLGYVATVLYYRHRARRTGVEGRIWPVVIAGLVPLGLMVAFSTNFLVAFHLQRLIGWFPVFTIQDRGLGPLLVIGFGLGVLAFLERSRSLAAFAGVYLALALLLNLYDIENQIYRLGLNLPVGATALPNLVLPGLFLLGAGFVFWWTDRGVLRQRVDSA